ncbi:MAG TPA: VWA domain-containing protein, partial [Pyrinomonadaceae bacterium]|nr:VWA domain-containing protein [Pyrinomonadaceae bacterium]
MKTRPSLALALSLSLFPAVLGQETKNPQTPPRPAPQQQQQGAEDDDDVVRITTNLVQVDAVITDKDGRLVTDLRPEEVEIFEDGRAQKITNFSFVQTAPDAPPAAQPKPPANSAKGAPPAPPPVRLKPEQVRRTVALVVDDLGLSFESTHYVRRALKKFVDRQLQPGDLVAIIRTAGGMGALQQFTSDRRQLYAAIERVRWQPGGRSGAGAFARVESNPAERMRDEADRAARSGMGEGDRRGMGRNAASSRDDDDLIPSEELDQFREDLFAVGTLGALNYVVRGMRELPGRKSVLLISDGIKIFNRHDPSRSSRVLDALRRLTDIANRASVVIYTMDARGLPMLGLTAVDDVSGLSPDQVEARLSDRRDDYFESQQGLTYIARQTGGFPIRNTNDLSAGIQRVLDDQKGYYLIGYRPEDSTFDAATGRRKFHKITLKLKRPGLKHRTRTGFYGVTDEEARPALLTREQQLGRALTSPFSTGGVEVRLTSIYTNDAKAGSYVRSLFHVEGRDLTFTDEPDDWHKATIDVVAVTFGDNGRVVDEVSGTHNLRVRGETYKQLLKHGFIYNLTVPIKKPGAYQLRAVVRDASSERIGSASQFIEVPDIKKNRLALSGILVDGVDPEAKPAKPQADAGGAEGAGAPAFESDPQASPAVRRFRRGLVLRYAFSVFNAQADKATGRPAVQTQMRLFREGQEIFTGRAQPLDATNQADLKRLQTGGALQLGTSLPPGEYALQVIVTDPLAKEKYRTATQWIDFEIV